MDALHAHQQWLDACAGRALPPNVSALLDSSAVARLDQIAIRAIEPAATLTYAGLGADVRRLACALARLGVGCGTRVACLMPNRIEFPMTWLALLSLGAVHVSCNVRWTATELDYAMTEAAAQFIVIDSAFLGTFLGIATGPARLPYDRVIVCGVTSNPALRWSDLVASGDSRFEVSQPAQLDQLCSIQYTSGSTGYPKGCMLTQRYWLELGLVMAERCPSASTILADHPFFYMDSQWMLICALFLGATYTLTPGLSGRRFLGWIREFGIHLAYLPKPLLKMEPSTLDRAHQIKLFLSGPISRDHVLAAEERFDAPIRQVYGMTEIGVVCTVPDVLPDEEILDTCGWPAPFRDLKVVDENGHPVPNGTEGELVVRGSGVCIGYYNDPDATAAAFFGDWFRTGDLFRVQPPERFKFVGRRKDMIRRSGENISAFEVEATIALIPEVAEAAAVAVPESNRGEEVKAFVRLQPGRTPSSVPPERILEFCRHRLAPFKIPRFISYVERFPYTASGKIAKTVLTSSPDSSAPIYDAERRIWQVAPTPEGL